MKRLSITIGEGRVVRAHVFDDPEPRPVLELVAPMPYAEEAVLQLVTDFLREQGAVA